MTNQEPKNLSGSRNVFAQQQGTMPRKHRCCMPLSLLALLVPCLLLLPCQSLHAQANTGLTGRVTDPSGASIPGAQITLTNEATGIKTQTAASSVGLYTTSLQAGIYDITVEATGFQKFEQTHVIVEVGGQATDNIKLTVGAISQTVEVSSLNSIHMDTTDPQLDTVLPTEEVTDLPLEINGYIRQITSFATLAPGVRSGPYGSVTVEGGASGQINSAGNYYNGVQIDTASDINSDPPYEMVDQFRVIRNAFSARYGMIQGAVDYNMRSGTNKLHGDAFFITRNSVFDSAGFFPTRFDTVTGKALAPIDNEKDWGGTIGGPVVLPKLYNGHNKTFFLFSIDLFNKDQGITTFGTVPTPAMKNGDFSQFVNASGVQIPIYDPQTGQQFMGCNGNQPNVICSNRIDPLSKTLLQYIPDPSAAGTNFGLQQNANPVIQSIPINNKAWGVTVNHQLSPSQNLAFTWWRNHYVITQEEDAPIVPVTNPLTGQEILTDNANVWLANYSKTWRPNLVMTVGFADQDKFQNNLNTNDSVKFAGITSSNTLPYISFGGGQNLPTNWGNSNSSLVQYYVDNKGWNFFNNWMWNKGRHTFNFGGEYHHYWETTLNNYSSGHFSFSNHETSTPNTSNANFSQYGSAFASFLLGLPDSANRSAETTTAVSTNAISGYIQDDFKATSKLTLNAGLRYDLMIPYTMSQNNNVFLNPTAPNPAANNLPGAATEYGNCTGCAGYNRLGIHDLYFGPRLGFAYSLDRNTVIQGGYTITYLGYNGAYGQGEGLSGPINNMAGLLGGSYTLNATGSNTSAYGQWTNPDGSSNPIPAVTPTPFSPGLGVAQTIYYLDHSKNGEAPILQMWTVSVQRQIPWHTMLTIDYTGNRVTHLSGYNRNPISQPDPSVLQYGASGLLTKNINDPAVKAAGFTTPYPQFAAQFGGGATLLQALKPFPQYSSVTRAWDQAASTYFSAFQIQADKHLSNNINFLANIELPRLYDNFITTVNKYNQAPEWGEDSTGSFESKLALLYQLPFGPGQHWLNRGETGRLLGGWQISGIVTYNNSQPLAITQTGGSPLVSGNRPNFNPGTKLWSGNYGDITKYFDGKIGVAPTLFSTAAWSLSAPTGYQYVLGNARRNYNAVRGPWYPVENLSVQKVFRITEGSSFKVRMDYFNALNRVQAPFPNTTLTPASTPGFGQVLSKFSPVNRQGQIEATFNF